MQGTLLAIWIPYSTFGGAIGGKVRHDFKISSVLKMSQYSVLLKVYNRYGKTICNLSMQTHFHFDCGSDDVAVWRQFWPSWRIYKSLLFFFCDNSKTYQNIIRFSVHVCRVYATKPVNIGVNVVNNDVIRFEDYFEFWITVISFLFGLECRSKGQTVGSAVGYLDDILKCECCFMQKKVARTSTFRQVYKIWNTQRRFNTWVSRLGATILDS